MITHLRRRIAWMRKHPEAGFSDAVELVVLGPIFFTLFLGLIITAGRIGGAEGATQDAAWEAARAASISRTTAEAQDLANAAAAAVLSSEGLDCTSTIVDLELTQLASPVGTAGQVSVSVTCVVPLSDIAIPGLPGQRTITATANSVIDTYRER